MTLRGDKYENADEIRMRLEGSIVLYDGDPVLIAQVSVPELEDADEKARVHFYNLPINPNKKLATTRKYLSSRKFDLTPFKMGFANIGEKAYFISRAPVRQNKQGLAAGTCIINTIFGKPSNEVVWNTLIRSEGFGKMVKGEYPSFEEASDTLKEDLVTSVAVSRSFALFKDDELDVSVLSHKGSKCGIILEGDTGVRVSTRFKFLKESLESCGIPMV